MAGAGNGSKEAGNEAAGAGEGGGPPGEGEEGEEGQENAPKQLKPSKSAVQ